MVFFSLSHSTTHLYLAAKMHTHPGDLILSQCGQELSVLVPVATIPSHRQPSLTPSLRGVCPSSSRQGSAENLYSSSETLKSSFWLTSRSKPYGFSTSIRLPNRLLPCSSTGISYHLLPRGTIPGSIEHWQSWCMKQAQGF